MDWNGPKKRDLRVKGRGGLTHRIAVEQENTQRGPGGVLQAQEEGLNAVEVLHVLGGKNRKFG